METIAKQEISQMDKLMKMFTRMREDDRKEREYLTEQRIVDLSSVQKYGVKFRIYHMILEVG